METGQRFDRIEAKLEQHDQRFDRIETKLEQHDLKFDRIETKLEEHSRKFDRTDELLTDMMKYMNRLTDRVDGLSERVDGLSERMDRHFQIALEASRSDFRAWRSCCETIRAESRPWKPAPTEILTVCATVRRYDYFPRVRAATKQPESSRPNGHHKPHPDSSPDHSGPHAGQGRGGPGLHRLW